MKNFKSTTRLISLLAVASLIALPSFGQIIVSGPPFTSFPSGDVRDGRFLSVVAGLAGLTQTPTAVGISLPPDTSEFMFRVFDGDTGELCDAADPSCADPTQGHWDEGFTPLCATMYWDPFRKGEPDPSGPIVGKWCSDPAIPIETEGPIRPDLGGLPLWEAEPHMPNNGWWMVKVRKTSEAIAPEGEAFFLVVFELDNPPPDDETVSNFKVSANVPLSIFSSSFGFEAGIIPLLNGMPIVYPNLSYPLQLPLDPDTFVGTSSTYDGQYNFYLDVVEPELLTLRLWDGDFDFGGPTTTAFPSGNTVEGCVDDNDENTPDDVLPPFAGMDVLFETAQGPGLPRDDSPFDVFRRDGCLTYTVTDPNGTVYRNVNPSGNQEWERFVITTLQQGPDEADYSPITAADNATFVSGEYLPTGLWKVAVKGLDLSNSVFWRFDQVVCGEVNGQPVCPDEPVMIGDRVWFDLDKDTVGGDTVNNRDGEPGIPGVKVNRVGSLDMTVTNVDGDYAFDVTPGNPEVPGQYEVELAPENFAVIPTGALGDRVFLDIPGEPGIPDVLVRLVDCSGGSGDGTTLAGTRTDTNGFYWFSRLQIELPWGGYCTVVDELSLPAGLTQTVDPDGVLDGMAETVLSVNDPVDDTLDYGYSANPGTAAIGDRVWVDIDNTGIQDPGEPGISGVRVDLFACGGGFVASAQTTGGGYYFFSDLVPGCYDVIVDETTLPPGYSRVSESFPDGSLDGMSRASLQAGDVVVDRDFGYVGQDLTGTGSPDFCLEDVIWFDADANGLFDLTETAIEGVTVTVSNLAGESVATVVSDSDGEFKVCGLSRDAYEIRITDRDGKLTELVGTTQPGIDGKLAVQVPVIVEIPPGSGQFFAIDYAGVNFGYVNQGRLAGCMFTTPDPLDSIIGEIPFDASGNPGNNLTFDFGCYFDPICLPIMDFEIDGEGAPLAAGQIIDDEFAAQGVRVTTNDPVNHPAMIFDSANPTGGDWDLGTPNETFPGGVGVGTGGESGQPGQNAVPFGKILIVSEDGDQGDPDDNGGGGTLIFTYDVPVKVSSVGIVDIDGAEAAGTIVAYDASGAQLASVPMQPLGNNSVQMVPINATDVSRLEVRFPASGGVTQIIYCVGSLGDRVWKDLNGDGVQDVGEPGINGVTTRLLNGQGVELGTDVTAGDGIYGFTGLPEGIYSVVVDDSTLPAGLIQTYDLDGALDHRTTVALGLEEDRLDLDFGYEPSPVCGLAIEATCRPILPPSGDLACKEKIAAFTVRYTGPSMSSATVQIDPDSSPTVTYSGIELVSGSTILSMVPENNYSIDAAPDNGDLGAKTKIFINGVMEEIHTSCSTPFVAGQPAPLNNPKGDPSPNWFVEAFRDKGGFEASVPLPVEPSDYCELPSADGTLCTERPISLSLQFNGGDCSQSSNSQPSDKWACSGDAGLGPVRVVARKDNDIYFDGDVDQGGVLDLLASAVGRNDLDSEISFEIYSGGSLVQSVYFHTSCSKSLAIGDRFGSLEVVAFENSNQGLVQRGGEVEYLYFIENIGSVLATNVEVNDIPHGFIGSLPSLVPTASHTFSKTLFITSDVTSTATVTADSAGGVCSAQDMVTVVVGDPDPVLGSLGDRVWEDQNADGVQDAGEPAINDVTVRLLNSQGFEIGTDVTAGDGIYRFTGLPEGSYSVVVDSSTLPPNMSQTYDLDGVLDHRTSVALGVQEDRDDLDFGYQTDGIVCTPGYVLDKFDHISYSNNDGPNNWAGDWIEVDPGREGAYADPSSGVRIRTDWHGGVLVLNDYPDTGSHPSAAREVDLSGAASAALSFDWYTHSGVDTSDKIVVEMSNDGGSSWTVLEAFTGFAGSRSESRSYDISAYISSQTQVRFRVAKYYGGSNENFKVNDLKISWTCEAGVCESMSYADEFNVASFTNNDGANNWAGPWIENDPENGGAGVSAGQVRVKNGALRLDDAPNTGGYPSAARKVDLSGKSSAFLHFDFDTSYGVDTSDAVKVEVSADGGGSWTVLETITGIYGATWQDRDYDISAYISSETMIRFRVSNLYGGSSEFFYVNRVQIDASCDPPPPPFPQASCADGKPWQLIFEYTGESCSASNNDQDKDECSGDPAGASPVSASPKSPDKFLVDPATESIAVGDFVTFSSVSGGKMGGDLEFKIKKGSYVKQTIKLHTSCSQPLEIGDQFGSVILRGFEAAP